MTSHKACCLEHIKELVSGQRRSMLQTKFQYVLEKINQSNSPGVTSTNPQITILISELNLWLLLQLGYFSELLDHSSTKINAYTNLTASVYKYPTNREQWQSLFYWSETGAANANTQVSLIAQASPLALHLEFKR